ncbi:MAG: hypothetical protein ABFR95_03805 [Actinomycetota bacterium]
MSDTEFTELLKSPYDKDPTDPEEMPWKLPVGAAIVGALVMAAYVLFAVVSGPTEDSTSTSTTPVAQQPVASASYPAGYVEVGENVALRADVVDVSPEGTLMYVSSATKGGADVSVTAPVEVASWTVQSTGTDPVMSHQVAAKGALGGVAVEIGPVFDIDNATAIATLPGVVRTTTDTVTLSPEVPGTLQNHRIAVDGGTVVIDEVEFGNGYGAMWWHLEDGISAKVAVTVTYDGVEFPLSLVEPHAVPPGFGQPTRPLAPLWNPDGETQLVRVGEPLSESNAATGVTILFEVSVVTEAGEQIEIPIGSVVRK